MEIQAKEGVLVRNAVKGDVDEIRKLEKSIWGKGGATKKMIQSRIKTFPRGNLVAIKEDSILGFGTMIQTSLNWQKDDFTWLEATDRGMIKGVYDPQGEIWYGLNLTIAEDWQFKGLASFMVKSIVAVGRELGCKWMVAGGRMPGYDVYCRNFEEVPPDVYLALKNSKQRILDPQIRFYVEMIGFKPIRSMPNYFDDPESRDFGCLLVGDLSSPDFPRG